jgi:glycosyltransferase involved in cell wall biosynthesis
MISDQNNNINPLVSIITPSYNCGNFIENTIESIKNQDYLNIQHIIIDGGSTDNTLEILKKYDDIEWISEPDSGMYDAINKGFLMAKGVFYTYINSDDYYESSDTVRTVVEEFKKNQDIHFTYGHCSFVDEHKKFMYTYRAPKFFKKYSIAFPRGTFAQPTCFWRKDIHIPFDSSLNYAADAKFFRYLCENFNGYRINKIIAKFTIRKDCISFQNIETMRKEDKEIYKDKNLKRPPLKFIFFDILYRMVLLNFRTNLKRMYLKFKGVPYL